jgi:diadenosine tetraphosphatase ApaH/serine/threonine PP2A family protein phosphatase
MATLFVGDVHGCASELEELIDDVRAERVVLVGDLFLKGPDPEGVWALVRDRGLESVLGNHDDRLLRHVDGEKREQVVGRCAHRLDAADPAWLPWLRSRPLFLEAADYTVVHAALHPSGDLEKTDRRMALNLRRWPNDAEDQPFWWQIYEGDRRVVFGHDARRGFVRIERDGRTQLVGLDTGCVYGGKLSGWIAEEDRLIQVEARKEYAEAGR